MIQNLQIFFSPILNRIKPATLLKLLSTLLAPIVLVIAGIYLRNIIIHGSWSDIENVLFSISPQRLVIAVILTFFNYAVMIGYDLFGLRYAGVKAGIKKISAVAFIGDSLNANLGFSAIIGSALKFKFYSQWGIPARAVIKAVAVYTIAHWLGFFFLASISLLLQLNTSFNHSADLWKMCAGVLFSLPVAFYLFCIFAGERIKWFTKLKFKIPDITTGLLLFLTGVIDWVLTALIFFIVMPSSSIAQFPAFASMYAFSHLAGMFSQVPGGIAVFESVALFFSGTDKVSLLGPLFLFRIIFFLLPFVFALIAFGIIELMHKYTQSKKKMKSKGIKNTSYKPSVSIVIPAYNEEHSISACLEAIKQQDYGGLTEIIVVNNARTHNTASIVKSMNIQVVNEWQRGYNHSVKRGFDEASNEIIVCTDADTIVPKDWISRLVDAFSNEKVVACGGVFRFSGGSLFIQSIGLFGRLNYHIAGANMAVKKIAYRQVGGFSTNVNLGADVELGQRLKKIGKVVIDRSIVVATSPRRFQSAFWETLFRYYLNDLALLIRGKPLFYSFQNYRSGTRRSYSGIFSTVAFALITILFVSGLILEDRSGQIISKVFANARVDISDTWTFNNLSGKITDTILNFIGSHSTHSNLLINDSNNRNTSELLKEFKPMGDKSAQEAYPQGNQ